VAIVRMKHVTLAGVAADRERFLERLQELGAIHLTPCVPAPESAESSTELERRVNQLQACLTMLDEFRHKPYKLEYTDDELPNVLCHLLGEWKQLHQRFYGLRHDIAVYRPAGDADPQDIVRLHEFNIYVQLWSVPAKQYDAIDFDEGVYHAVVDRHEGIRFCTVRYGEPVALEPPAVEMALPPEKVSALEAKASSIRDRIEELSNIFSQTASRRSVIVAALNELRSRLAFALGQEGSYADETLFGLEGWVPDSKTDEVRTQLEAVGRPMYLAFRDPLEDENPPVLTKSPAWARPARAFFNILGVVPGYTEYDISPVFVIAIALFTAMLIGDAGYGLILLIPLLIFYKRLRYKLKVDPDLLHMVIILAAATSIFGTFTMNFFGWTPSRRFVLLDSDDWSIMMKLCFVIGVVHLTAAHLWRAGRKFTEPVPARGLADLGWIAVLWAAFFLVLNLVLSEPLHPALKPLGLGGIAVVILFTAPQRNVLMMVGRGIADVPLNMVSCFADVVSYVRLMAVGAAGVVMERTFNELAVGLHNVVLTPVILVLAHSLVLALGVVAIVVHGVRLNLLEFSGHMDITWSGRKYEPFCSYMRKENLT